MSILCTRPSAKARGRTGKMRGRSPNNIDCLSSNFKYIRPYPLENTGSRPLSHSQASEGWISSWVGDDQRIPGVVCIFAPVMLFVLYDDLVAASHSGSPRCFGPSKCNTMATWVLHPTAHAVQRAVSHINLL